MMDVRKLSLDERAQCAAYMRAIHNMSQVEIGHVLGGLSQPQVSRLLAHAERQNYLVIEQRFASELFSDGWIRQIDEMLAPSGMAADLNNYCQRAGIHTPRMRVFESGPGNTEVALAQRRARFGRTAAGRLIELIEKSSNVGVAWGRTIKALTDGITASRQPLNKNRQITFSPVCAELVSLAHHGYSSSRLADILDEAFNKAPGQGPQLTGFPAYIPRHYDVEMRASIWRFISDTPGHHRVFSGPDALIHQMDMLISSIGSANTPVLGSFDELVLAGGLKANDLRQLVIGDLGGILVPKTGLSKAKQALIDDLNELWTGMKTEHVHAIAERAFADNRLSGVVVVAIQTERGDTAFELICRGLVNELILDQSAATQLQRRLNERQAP
jgi:DNA-binding transcriptional regulator LsrR (DeoR family)